MVRLSCRAVVVWMGLCLASGLAWADSPSKLVLSTPVVPLGNVDPTMSPVDFVGALSATVRSSAKWALVAQALGDFRAPDGTTVPIGRLSWRTQGGNFTSFATTSQTVATGDGRANRGEGKADVTFDLRLDVQWLDSPGSYTATLVFTLVEGG
jgi:hypothetical protein